MLPPSPCSRRAEVRSVRYLPDWRPGPYFWLATCCWWDDETPRRGVIRILLQVRRLRPAGSGHSRLLVSFRAARQRSADRRFGSAPPRPAADVLSGGYVYHRIGDRLPPG